jgi:hypothetical protein
MKTWLSIAAAVVVGLAVGHELLPKANAQTRPTWIQQCDSFGGAQVDLAAVNARVKQLGAEGFELVGLSTAGYNTGAALFVCFKRPGK